MSRMTLPLGLPRIKSLFKARKLSIMVPKASVRLPSDKHNLTCSVALQPKVILPGEYVELKTPDDTDPDTTWAVEPRLDSPTNLYRKPETAWPKVQELQSVNHSLRLIIPPWSRSYSDEMNIFVRFGLSG